MKKNFILFISLFAMFCVSCSQLFDFSAKKSSIAFTLPASVFSSIDNKREDWSPEPMYRSTYSMNVVITDQDGNVVKEIIIS